MTIDSDVFSEVATDYLVRCSIESAILIPLIILIQKISGERLSPTAKHALWLILLIRLSFPSFPESRLSLFSATDWIYRDVPSNEKSLMVHRSTQRSPFSTSPRQAENLTNQDFLPSLPTTTDVIPESNPPTVSDPTIIESSAIRPHYPAGNEAVSQRLTQLLKSPTQTTPKTSAFSWERWGLAIWMAGIVLLSIRITIKSLRFRRQLKQLVPTQESAHLRELENTRKALGIKKTVMVYQTDCVVSPAVYGLWKPMILLPSGFLDNYSVAEITHVLSHEFAHIKRLDALWNLWSTIIQLIHWPNPLIWFATRRMRSDRELATDFLALRSPHKTDPHAYGETILKTLQAIPSQKMIPGLIGIAEDRHRLVRRFNLIARFQRSRLYSKPLVVLILMLLGLTSLTDPTISGQSNQELAKTPDHTIQVYVTDASTGHPIPGVMITSLFGPILRDETREIATVTTDHIGLAVLELNNPPGPETWLTLNAIPKTGYVSQLRYWRSDEDFWNQLPNRHEFQLEQGIEIGGTIVDERHQPLANVAIELSGNSGTDGGDSSKKNVSRLFAPFELGLETDIHGRWTCSVAPKMATRFKLLLRKPNGPTHQCATPSPSRGLALHRNGAPLFTSELQDKTSLVVFPEGKKIEITINDESGQPVAGTSVQELTGQIFRKLGTISITDQLGIARFESRIGHEIAYIATHPEHANSYKVLNLIEGETSATIVIQPKKQLQGTIQDRAGNPIARALVNLDTETNEPLHLNWSIRSGPEGQFHWDNAPLTKAFYQVRADGFATQVIEASPADGPIRIILDEPTQAVVTHTAHVVDAETNQPIQKFSYRRGRELPFDFRKPVQGSSGIIAYTAPTDQIVDSKNSFHGKHYRIEASAPGYQDTLSRAISIHETNADIQIKLQPNPKKYTFKNVIIQSTSGENVAGALVRLVGFSIHTVARFALITRAQSGPKSWDASYLISNADGRLPAAAIPIGFRGISIINDRGSIMIPAEELDLSKGKIQLLPLGKIEGMLRVNGEPKAGLRVDLRIVPEEEGLFSGTIYTTSNESGRFIFDKIPHGNYRLFRSNTAMNSFVSLEYYPMDIQVQPGQTRMVDYHIDGQSLSGRFVTDPPRNDLDWQEADPWWIEGNYILRKATKAEEPLQLPPRRDQYLTNRRWHESHTRSRRQHDATQSLSVYTYPLDVTPKGHFRATSVPPGEYVLEAKLVEMLGIEKGRIRKQTLGTHSRRITIPDGPRENTIDLGTIPIPINQAD